MACVHRINEGTITPEPIGEARHRPANGLENRRRALFLRSISPSNHYLNINSYL